MTARPHISHGHLKVRELDRSIAFYTRYLGQRLKERVGDHYAFLTGSDAHHEIALNAVGPDAPAAEAHAVGLFHIAFEVPTKADFAAVFQSLVAGGVPVGPVDHLISWAMYFDDPDGNGLEVFVDTRGAPGGEPLWRGRNEPLTAETILAAGRAETEGAR